MSNVLWFGLGGIATYVLLANAKKRGSAKVSFSIGADVQGGAAGQPAGGRRGLAYKGNQEPVSYQPLGTVGGRPGGVFGFDGYIAYGGQAVPGGGNSWTQQDVVSSAATSTIPTFGTQMLPADQQTGSV